jgi:hypothetical protein
LAIEDLQDKKKQLTDLADVLNGFKSEAVQLRLLEYILGENGSNSEPHKKRNNTKPIWQRKQRKQAEAPAPGGGAAPQKKRAAAPGNGPNATVTQLVEGDFFKKPQTIGAIVEHCKHNLARSFKTNEISTKLAQLVRTGQLTRAKNADKQYEYKKP